MTLSVKTIAHSWEHTSPNTQLLRWRADSPAIPPQCLVCTACTPGALVSRHLIAQVAVQGGKTSGHFSSLDLAPQWAFAHHSLGYSGDSLKGAGRLAKPRPLGHAECLNSNILGKSSKIMEQQITPTLVPQQMSAQHTLAPACGRREACVHAQPSASPTAESRFSHT